MNNKMESRDSSNDNTGFKIAVSEKAEPVRQTTETGTSKTKRVMVWDFKARGEPFVWGLGGALVLGILMIFGFIALIVYNGALTFVPKPIEVLELTDGSIMAGEPSRYERIKASPELLASLDDESKKKISEQNDYLTRTLYRIGNFDLYNEDFRWVSDYQIAEKAAPKDIFFFERMEWGPFIGRIKSVNLNGKILEKNDRFLSSLKTEQAAAAKRRNRIREIERTDIAAVNHDLEEDRLGLRKIDLQFGQNSPQYKEAADKFKDKSEKLESHYQELSREASALKERDSAYTLDLAEVSGKEKQIKLSDIVRFYPANDLTFFQEAGIYASRWWEFLSKEPREANTEGGVMPAIFGTFCMTVLMALSVAPFGVVGALYLREYAKQGRLVSLVRICVNNLAGVPSIVYGVFGLGFFAYMLGGSIDRMFYPERLPTPTFGTGGLLWSSLTLALLTVPVVIVATEEALAAVPQSLREGSLACGASKWQTIKYIVLPRAMPGIMTGLILAMARGAGEVAPLMLVGVVKMAPELPIDQFFPYIHLDRSFMHLGFHIFDVGFQSRNSEAAKPIVFVTTLLLISLVFVMNAVSIMVRNRLKRKFFTGHF